MVAGEGDLSCIRLLLPAAARPFRSGSSTADTFAQVREQLGAAARRFAETAKFEPKAGQSLLLPGENGALSGVLFGLESAKQARQGPLPARPPARPAAGRHLSLRQCAARYAARRARVRARLLQVHALPQGGGERRQAGGARRHRRRRRLAHRRGRRARTRPDQHAGERHGPGRTRAGRARPRAQARRRHHARSWATICCKQNFPLIHAVGRASPRAPRLIDLTWGDAKHPKITLVGKGVCFDTGGLDIKPDSGMLIMKKDMGGAANVLAAAHMIMDAKLKVRLRVLIPAVENAISGDAFRPLDVYRSRKGITVEIGNTDAEGRLVLADALALADEEAPGPDRRHGDAHRRRARRARAGTAAVLHARRHARVGSGASRRGGARSAVAPAAVAALRVDARFEDRRHQQCRRRPGGRDHGRAVPQPLRHRAKAWAHFDIYAWTPSAKPARPDGGECQVARALYALLKERYSSTSARRAEKKSQNNPMQRTNSGMRVALADPPRVLKQFGSETIRTRPWPWNCGRRRP